MVNRCSVSACKANHRGHSTGYVFKLPQKEPLKSLWTSFIERSHFKQDKMSCLLQAF